MLQQLYTIWWRTSVEWEAKRKMSIQFHRPESSTKSLFVTTGRAWKLQSGFRSHLQKLSFFFSFPFLFVFFTAAIVARRDKRKGRTHSLQLCTQDMRAESWEGEAWRHQKLWRLQCWLFIFLTPGISLDWWKTVFSDSARILPCVRFSRHVSSNV